MQERDGYNSDVRSKTYRQQMSTERVKRLKLFKTEFCIKFDFD